MGRTNVMPSGLEVPHVMRHVLAMHDAILAERWGEALAHATDAWVDLRYVRRWLKEKAELEFSSALPYFFDGSTSPSERLD